MNRAVSYKTAVCAQYEIMLKECRAALETLDERLEQVRQSHSSGKEVGDELLRLEADFAKAYAVLERHARDCEICQFFAKKSGGNSEYDLDVSPRRRMPA